MVLKLKKNEIDQLKGKDKPFWISKSTYKLYKKFGITKCLYCKSIFVRSRSDQYYCSYKCKTYHYRKVGAVGTNHIMEKCRGCKKIFDRCHTRGPAYCYDCDSKRPFHHSYYWTIRRLKGRDLFS